MIYALIIARKEECLADLFYRIKWHPGFYAATELEFKDDLDLLELIQEYSLSKEPLRVDLLIVKKTDKDNKLVEIKNEIGHIMRKYNIVEYKSPGDGLTIDDFSKTLAYAFLYKGYGKRVNQIPLEELTISLFREKYPKKMFKMLTDSGFVIKEKYPGIYYVTGNVSIPIQIVVISRLSPEKHSSLRILTKNAGKDDVKRFIIEMGTLTESGELDNADAVLQVSGSANYDLYNELRGDEDMCEVMHRLLKDEIDKKCDEAMSVGKREGKRLGEIKGKTESVKNVMKKLSYTAEQAMDLLEISESQRRVIMKSL